MTENVFQFLWRYRLYHTKRPLRTTDNEPIIVLDPGLLNRDSGPDFLHAQIRIGNTLWVGHVELHLRSSDWIRHQHNSDPAYTRLILHVVFEDDEPIKTLDGTSFPTLELKEHIDEQMIQQYARLMKTSAFIPCGQAIVEVDEWVRQNVWARMLSERLEMKTEKLQQYLGKNQNDWLGAYYVFLARAFGLYINADAFEELAIRTPLSLLQKHRYHPLQVEALLFGQAGFLNDYFDEAYPQSLQREYEYLQSLYQLQPMEKHHWKFLRLRPAAFPTLRIAQWAALICTHDDIFSMLLEANEVEDVFRIFSVSCNDYWLTHYTFTEVSAHRKKILGTSFLQTLVVNALVPFLFLYGKQQGSIRDSEKALRWLQSLAAEDNHLIRQWQQHGIVAQNAAESQALLQLKTKYCDERRCLDCSIAYQILSKSIQANVSSVSKRL